MQNEIEITQPDLTQYQKDILNSKSRFTIVEACTKSGKTFSHLWWLFKTSLTPPKKGANYWWVAPVYSQAKIAFKRLTRVVERYPQFRINQSELYIETPAGSYIHFKSADKHDNLYGEDVYGAVFDEFTRAKEDAWHALRSTLTHTKAPCKFIGNYRGEMNWGHQLALKAGTDSNYEYFRITAWDAVEAGILSKQEVEQAREDLPLSVFNTLYLAKGSDRNDRMITDAEIESFLKSEIEPGEPKYLTADIAMQGSDLFVIIIWADKVIIDYHIMDKSTPKQVEEQIKGMADKHNIPRKNICYDADGLGTYLSSYLSGANPFNNGATAMKEKGRKVEYDNLKSQCYFGMADKISRGQWGISCDFDIYTKTLKEDLSVIIDRNFGKDGKRGILKKTELRELIGRSPDISDAIMMRYFFELSPSGTKAINF
jgi:hypothetical protein